MINANELRVGNYILVEIEPDLPRWHKVQPTDIYVLGSILPFKVEPIPLTPEILEKCGALELPNWRHFAKSMVLVNKNI